MTETTPAERIADLRARIGRSRITRRQIARALPQYHYGYIAGVLSGYFPVTNTTPVLNEIERVVARFEVRLAA